MGLVILFLRPVEKLLTAKCHIVSIKKVKNKVFMTIFNTFGEWHNH